MAGSRRDKPVPPGEPDDASESCDDETTPPAAPESDADTGRLKPLDRPIGEGADNLRRRRDWFRRRSGGSG